jgi:hypothetical protein
VLGFFGSTGLVVFGGLQPSVEGAIQIARDEALLWTVAGAKGLSLLQSVAVVG